MSYDLVWFKRDLCWHDHQALEQASNQGPVLCIFVIEPDLTTDSKDSSMATNGACVPCAGKRPSRWVWHLL